MYRIKTYNKISINGLNRFPRDQYEIASEISHADAILLRSHKLAEQDLNPELKAIARAGAGVNNIPIEACTKKGIVVFNTPGANANAVKEMVLSGLLMSSRGLLAGTNFVQNMKGLSEADMHAQAEQGKKQFAGNELMGKTLGVVGLGAIGALVANMALELGMQVIGYDPALSVESAWRLSSKVQRAENLTSLLSKSDYITLHVPAIEATRHLINQETLKQCKAGARLINFARETIVDTDALISALDQDTVSTYVADFPAPGLLGRDDVILFPHLGASTAEAEDNCAIMAADQLTEFLSNGNIKNSVNFPTITLDRTSGYRITFANDNVPKVLSQVLDLIGDLNINVIDILNKSRNGIAYNILDVEQQPTDELLQAIASVEHVFAVRAIS